MMTMKRRLLSAITVTTVCVVGVTVVGVGLAGASQRGGAFRGNSQELRPFSLSPGTYNWFLNGSDDGTITFASNNTFTSTIDDDDSGSWVQAGRSFAFYVTAGEDAGYGCTFSGKISSSGTKVGKASKPGNYVCPAAGANGTFYLTPGGGGDTTSSADVLRRHSLVRVRNGLVAGTYNWFINGTDAGTITFASNNTFTSTVDTNDSGTWVEAGKEIALSITGGSDVDGDIVFAGKVSSSGTKIGKASKPGNWAAPGYASTGTFYVS
jgi:hypothetical protein